MVPLPTHDTPTAPIRNSLRRVISRSSVVSAVPRRGVLDLSLADVCSHIDDHPSLQAAQIISTECYAMPAGAVTHRFLILELRRPNREDVWLRLDRLRGEGVSIMRFLSVSGVTTANDRVRCLPPSFSQLASSHELITPSLNRLAYPPTKSPSS